MGRVLRTRRGRPKAVQVGRVLRTRRGRPRTRQVGRVLWTRRGRQKTTRVQRRAFRPLIAIDAEQEQDALDLFASNQPPPSHDGAADVELIVVADPSQASPPPDVAVRKRLSWRTTLAAATLAGLATIGLTMSVYMMRGADSSQAPEPPARGLAPSLTTLPDVEPTPASGPEDRTRERVETSVQPDRAPRERLNPEPARSSVPPKSRETPTPFKWPVRPEPRSGPAAEPVRVPEPIGTAALDALIPPAKVLAEPGPVVEERVTPAVPDRAESTARGVSPSEAGAIQAVLGRYRTAFSRLDAGAASAIWPSVDLKALSRAFERLERQELVFNNCHIAILDARAVASCGGSARYVPRSESEASATSGGSGSSSCARSMTPGSSTRSPLDSASSRCCKTRRPWSLVTVLVCSWYSGRPWSSSPSCVTLAARPTHQARTSPKTRPTFHPTRRV